MNTMRIFLAALAAIALTGCASTHSSNPADPFQSFNRGMYRFNDTVDKAVAKPLAQGYNKVMPEVGKVMVTNFFSNLDDIIVTANDLLQFKLVQGFSDAMRVMVNTTVGVGGLIDIASLRLEKHNEDFGQTLGKWGVANGPYIVLPFLGPSTLRDGIGLYVDSYPSRIRRIKHMRTRNQMYATKVINRRAQLFDQEKVLDEAAVDRYEYMRDAYLLRRQSLVYDGHPPRDQDDDEQGDGEIPQAPAQNQSSLQQDDTSAAPLASHFDAQRPASPVAFELHQQPGVHRVWVTQRSAIR